MRPNIKCIKGDRSLFGFTGVWTSQKYKEQVKVEGQRITENINTLKSG